MNKPTRVTLQIGGCLLLVAIVVAVIILICSITVPAKADSYDFPPYWQHDANLVKSVQRVLIAYGEEDIEVDGKFGPKTGQGVKNLQYRYNLAITGVVDDSFAYTFGVENWPYNQGYTLRYIADLDTIYARKSDYEDLIYISTGGDGYDASRPEATGSHLFLFRDGELIADSPCIIGNEKKGYFTPLGVHKIVGRRASKSGSQASYYNLLHLGELVYISSTLDYFDPRNDHQVLGAHTSNGSIRIPADFAEWLYKNLPNGITVVIDDRTFMPAGAPGYQHLLDENSQYADYADWEWDYDEADDLGTVG